MSTQIISQTSLTEKPKKRFRIEDRRAYFVVIDEMGVMWLNGHSFGMAYAANDSRDSMPKTLEEAQKCLPDPATYDFLPPDEPLVWVIVDYRDQERYHRTFSMFPAEAERVRAAIGAKEPFIEFRNINGTAHVINMQDIANVAFHPY